MTRKSVDPAARFRKYLQERGVAAIVAFLRVRHVDCVLHVGVDGALWMSLDYLGREWDG